MTKSVGDRRALSVRQARTCEEALEPVCKCRCGGVLHGAARGGTRAFFESLPATDPHYIPSAAAKRIAAAIRREQRERARLDALLKVLATSSPASPARLPGDLAPADYADAIGHAPTCGRGRRPPGRAALADEPIPPVEARAEDAAMLIPETAKLPDDVQALYLLGRCANGSERDKGRLVHAVRSQHVALCGATYGRRSAGWQVPYVGADEARSVTCPRCLKKL